MGIRSSKSRSVDITTPGAEVTTPTEAKASANGGTDLQEYHEKKLENGEQHAPAEQKDTSASEEIPVAKSQESKPVEDTSDKVEEAREVKENGGTEGAAAAAAAAPIANAEKLDNGAETESDKKDEEDRVDDDKEKKREKAKEDNKKEKREEERKRKEEEKKRKEEEKKRKEEEKKEKKKDKKRSFSFLQKKKKKEESPNGDADAKEVKPEEIREEVKAESAEQPVESSVVPEESNPSAAEAVSETKNDATDITENITVNESTHEAVAAVAAADNETGETQVTHETNATVSEVTVENTAVPEKLVQSPEVTTTSTTATEKVEEPAVPLKITSEEAVIVPTKSEEVEEAKPTEEKVTDISTSPTLTLVQSEPEPSLPAQQPVAVEVVDEIPPPPPTPPLVSESPAQFESAPKPPTPDPVSEEMVVPPPPPSPPVTETSTESQQHAQPKPFIEIIEEHVQVVVSEEIAQPQETEEALVIPPPPLSEDLKDIQPQELVLIEKPSKDHESGKVTGSYTTELTWTHGGKKVAIRGSFNDWKETVELLERDGLFFTKLDLSAGDHYIQFQVDGNWTVDNDQPIIQLDGEGQVNVFSVKPDASEE